MQPGASAAGSSAAGSSDSLSKAYATCRERYEASLSMPLLPQQRVKMLWRDAADPSQGEWYSGMVVQEGKEYGPPAQAVWEGISVMWDADGSKSLPHTVLIEHAGVGS